MSSLDDADLVGRALRGSQDAYRELVVRYQRPVYGLALRMIRDAALAEDLAQEVFLKAFRSLDSFSPDRRFSSWLLKIAHNACLDHLRRRHPHLEPLTGDDAEDPGLLAFLADPAAEAPDAAQERTDLRRALEESIAALRPQYREVILLRHQEDLAYEEIAEITGLPLGTVKTHLHRARRALADALRRRGWGPRSAEGETRAREGA
jgi:RNA polymerase sigma-70 factor (ECF subfamily)